jgi:hypothetical protein
MMNIEIAFLLGVFAGQWLMLSILYWATTRTLKELLSAIKETQTAELPCNESIYFPPEDFSDKD